MVTLNIDKADCKNLAELLELYIPQALHDYYESGELDNIEYIRSLLNSYDALKEAGEEKR